MRRPRTVCLVAAAIAYLAIALWSFRAVLPAPATLLPENPHLEDAYRTLGRLDRAMVLWIVTGNADRILDRPAQLRAEGQCHPLPRAYTLGEHMLGESLLASVPLALTGDPIASYNVLLIASLWIAALAMFLCARHFTRSDPAAFVAGLLFCLEPARIKDTAHPFVHGDLWAPLALLFLQRTFARGGVSNALGCALFVALTVLESLYVLLGVLLMLLAYGVYAAWRHRHDVVRWLPPLMLAALPVIGLAVVVLRPYLVARATWGGLVRSGTTFVPLDAYAPGHAGFPGWILLALAGIGLADRARVRRDTDGEDPRLAWLAAMLLLVWSSVRTLSFLGLELPSPLLLLEQIVPGADAVRALGMAGRVAALPASLLAGYGVLVLVDRRRAVGAASIAAVLSVLVVVERWSPVAARATFGEPLTLTAYDARPPDEDVALLRANARGAILDLPHAGGDLHSIASGGYLILDAFSPRPVAACYDSFPSPLEAQVSSLAFALPRVAAIDALVALGFETLLLHTDRMDATQVRFFSDLINVDPAIGDRLQLVGRSDRLLVFRMQSPTARTGDPAVLAAAACDADVRTVPPGRGTLELSFTNSSALAYAQRPPIEPLAVEARWRDAGGVVHTERTRALLPIALGPGAQTQLPVELVVPPLPGNHDLTIALAAAPDVPLAWTRVTVAPATP